MRQMVIRMMKLLKKEKYRLRLTKRNPILGALSSYIIAMMLVLDPIIAFLFGYLFSEVEEVDLLIVFLLLLILTPLVFVAFVEKYVFKILYEADSDHREDLEIVVAMDKLAEAFRSYIDDHPELLELSKPLIDSPKV